MSELISIIVPVFNAEDTLSRCVDSIINQDYKNIEIILINDGSTDSSYSICKEFEKQDARVVVIDSCNRGVSSARNLGMEAAKGNYLGFVDADDWIEPDYFKHLHSGMIQKENICMASIGIVSGKWENYLDTLCNSSPMVLLSNHNALHEVLKESGLRGYLWNKLFLNSTLRLNPAISVCEDLEFVVRYLFSHRGKDIVVLNQCLYHYDTQPPMTFSSIRYDFKRLATRLIAYDMIIETLSPSEKSLITRVRSFKCKYAYQMLIAWYSQPITNRTKTAWRENLIESAYISFNENFREGFEAAHMKYKVKYLLVKYFPQSLILFLRMKEKLGIKLMEREEI